MREKDNDKDNIETVKTAVAFKNKGVVAIDLAGDEYNFKTKNFEYIFSLLKTYSLPATVHAGEADGKESINSAIEFGAVRIGHGIRSVFDSETVERIVLNKIPLEVCITSNVQTKATVNLKMHPVRKLYDKGVIITVNSDNMTVSDTDVFKELRIAKNQFGIDTKELLINSVNAAFCDDDLKEYLRKKIKWW